jgi:phosphatidylinositol glycan class O
MNQVAKALATHVVFYAAIALATVVEAAWLRRHLMLYRIFMPRMLLGVVVLLVVELVGVIVGLLGIRSSIRSVAEVFGWGPLVEEAPVQETQPVVPEPAAGAETVEEVKKD